MRVILDKIDQYYLKSINQTYLSRLYKTIIAMAYYKLMCISELVKTENLHAVKFMDIHVSLGNRKLWIVLRSSKTHTKMQKPQLITITGTDNQGQSQQTINDKIYCPFRIIVDYISARNSLNIREKDENLLIFSDGRAVNADQVRRVLKKAITKANLDANRYNTHSFHMGRATDLFKVGISVNKIKEIGRWKSNCIYDYLKRF